MSYSQKVTVNIAEGSKLYGIKQFEEAASKYADACAAYNEEHGTDDADLLLLYGKALFQSGVTKSGVLGGIDADGSDDPDRASGDEGPPEDEDKFHFDEGVAQEVDDEADDEANDNANQEDDQDQEENDDQADENDEDNSQDGPDQSDFEAAWEILDLTRSLFQERLDRLSNEGLEKPYLSTDDEESTNEYVSTLKKLAETFDLLGEVSLEAENFPQAAIDLESCLKLRQDLYKSDSALISESHYKLSLALELCVDDEKLREKATEQMRLAIESVKARNSKESDEEKKRDTQDLLRDLEERYKELQNPPEADLQAEQVDIIKGILGEAVGAASGGGATSSLAQPANDLTTSVKKKAAVNDLSSMVKKRKPNSDDDSSKRQKKQ